MSDKQTMKDVSHTRDDRTVGRVWARGEETTKSGVPEDRTPDDE